METTNLTKEQIEKYDVETLTDFANQMYEYKCDGDDSMVKEMALALNNEQAAHVIDKLTTLLHYDMLLEEFSVQQLIEDFFLNGGPI